MTLQEPVFKKQTKNFNYDYTRDSPEEIKSTLQKMTLMRFWLILTPQIVYFEKQVSTSEVLLGKAL